LSGSRFKPALARIIYYNLLPLEYLSNYLCCTIACPIRSGPGVHSWLIFFHIPWACREPFGFETCRRALRLWAQGRTAHVESLTAERPL